MTETTFRLKNLQNVLPMETFSTEAFTFQYPKGGAVVPTEREGKVARWQVWVNIAGEEFSISIEAARVGASAQHLAEEIFAYAHPMFVDEDISPCRLPLEGIEIWRTRHRFVDGGRAPLVIDSALASSGQNGPVLLAQYYAAPELYPVASPVFDTFLCTLRLS